jgi:hypothetical protein
MYVILKYVTCIGLTLVPGSIVRARRCLPDRSESSSSKGSHRSRTSGLRGLAWPHALPQAEAAPHRWNGGATSVRTPLETGKRADIVGFGQPIVTRLREPALNSPSIRKGDVR